MSDTTFTTKETVIEAAWLNDVNDAVHQGSGRVALGVTDLRSKTPASDQTYYLKYHTTIGDGGHGLFRAVTGASAGTYVDNGGTIIVPTSGDGSSAWLREDIGYVSPRMFGASKNASASTNSNAIQASLDYVVSTATASSLTYINSIKDHGLLCLDLEGVSYGINASIVPPNGGGWGIRNGSLYDDGLTAGAYLIDMSGTSSSSYDFENVLFDNLLLECNHNSNGILADRFVRFYGDHVYILKQKDYGLRITNNWPPHELLWSNFIVAEYVSGETNWDNIASRTSIGVSLESPDHQLVNGVISYCSNGVKVDNGNNIIDDVHVYQGTGSGNTDDFGAGFLQKSGSLNRGNRYTNCSVDNCRFEVEDPNSTVISGCHFFYNGGDTDWDMVRITVKTASLFMRGLVVTDNNFRTVTVDCNAFGLDERTNSMSHDNVYSTYINNNTFDKSSGFIVRPRTTQPRLSISDTNTVFQIDMSGFLPFGNIKWANYAYSESSVGSGFTNHKLRSFYQPSSTFTADASTDLLTHSFSERPMIAEKVRVSTTGGLPGGLSAATDYYAIPIGDATMKLATTISNAWAGTAIDITSAGSGTHTVTKQLTQGITVELAASQTATIYGEADINSDYV